MASYCKVLIVATGEGASFTDDAPAKGATTRLLRQVPSGESTCKALLPVYEKPVLSRWLDTIKRCPRLMPVSQKVFILASPNSYEAISSWASAPENDFPKENIIATEEPGTEACAVADGVAAYIKATGEPDATLAVIEANYLFEPEFEISRVIEHAMVRGKDCVTFSRVSSVMPMIPRACIAMEVSERSPKVTAVDGMREPIAGDVMLGPLTILRKTSVKEIGLLADGGCPADRQLASFLQRRVESRGLLSGLQFGECFRFFLANGNVETMEAYMFTHYFYEWYKQQKEGIAGTQLRVADSNIFMSEDVRLGGDVVQKVEDQLELLDAIGRGNKMQWSSRLDIAPLLLAFKDVYARRQAEEAINPDKDLPSRFANAGTWAYKTSKQEHPVFTTSNNAYGMKLPTQPQMANAYHGLDGRFTNAFPSNYKNDSLKVSKGRSKVHSELDEF